VATGRSRRLFRSFWALNPVFRFSVFQFSVFGRGRGLNLARFRFGAWLGRALIVQNVWPKRKRNCRKLLLGSDTDLDSDSASTSDHHHHRHLHLLISFKCFTFFLMFFTFFIKRLPRSHSLVFFLVWLRFYKVIGFCFSPVEIYFGGSLSCFMGYLDLYPKRFLA